MERFNPSGGLPGFSPYNGFLNIRKEAGYTSMDVCAKLRGILSMKRIGHAGTLDPAAEGVLPVARGRATKDVDLVSGGTKVYRAVMLLGVVTDTQDMTGTVLSETALPPELDETRIRETIASFAGGYEQLTPMYSARKVDGRPLYRYARAGKEAPRKTQYVEIPEIVVDEIALPRVTLTVTCGKGTYIRTLCHDIGEALLVGAAMESLVRLRVGDFRIEDAVTLDEVTRARDEGRVDTLLSVKHETAVAIGKFDGLHLGHEKLLRELRTLAQDRGLKSLVLILNSGAPLLESSYERRRMLAAFGIDYVMELPFTEALRETRAETFLREILLRGYHTRAIVAGPDVSFGKGREGDAAYLARYAEEYGYTLHIVQKSLLPADSPYGAAPISSSLVRKALSDASMDLVTKLLGRPYAFCGIVRHGRHLGESILGLATANLSVGAGQACPPCGVYASRVTVLPGDRLIGKPMRGGMAVFAGISNLGRKPTLSDAPDYDPEAVDLETHLFDYDGDLYGKRVRVELYAFIRPERRFADLSALREQLLTSDIPQARK